MDWPNVGVWLVPLFPSSWD